MVKVSMVEYNDEDDSFTPVSEALDSVELETMPPVGSFIRASVSEKPVLFQVKGQVFFPLEEAATWLLVRRMGPEQEYLQAMLKSCLDE